MHSRRRDDPVRHIWHLCPWNPDQGIHNADGEGGRNQARISSLESSI
jgi:hypothetical protein